MTSDAEFDDVLTAEAIARHAAGLAKFGAPPAGDLALLADQLLTARDTAIVAAAGTDQTIIEIVCDTVGPSFSAPTRSPRTTTLSRASHGGGAGAVHSSASPSCRWLVGFVLGRGSARPAA